MHSAVTHNSQTKLSTKRQRSVYRQRDKNENVNMNMKGNKTSGNKHYYNKHDAKISDKPQ